MTELFPADQLEGWPHPRAATQVIGQAAQWQEIQVAWSSGRMPHCWLFTGDKGIGKATLAYKFARMVQGKGQPLTVVKREPDEKGTKLKSVISIDEIRKLKQSFEKRTAEGQWRVCIIDTIDEMNTNAANALLKLIEEPPQRSLFLLLSHSPGGVLPTIRSRARPLSLSLVKFQEITVFLQDHGIKQEIAHTAATLSGGAIGRAARFANPDVHAFVQQAQIILQGLPHLDIKALLVLAEMAVDPQAFATLVDVLLILLYRVTRCVATQAQASSQLPNEPLWYKRWEVETAHLWAAATSQAKETFHQARTLHLDPQRTILTVFSNLRAAVDVSPQFA